MKFRCKCFSKDFCVIYSLVYFCWFVNLLLIQKEKKLKIKKKKKKDHKKKKKKSLLGNILAGKVVIATSQGQRINRAEKGRGKNTAGECVVRAGYGNKNRFLMPPHPLTSF